MYFFDNVRHELPHIYTKYQGAEAVFSMSDVSLLSGDLPVSRTRLTRPGLKSIGILCSQTGFWPLKARHCFK